MAHGREWLASVGIRATRNRGQDVRLAYVPAHDRVEVGSGADGLPRLRVRTGRRRTTGTGDDGEPAQHSDDGHQDAGARPVEAVEAEDGVEGVGARPGEADEQGADDDAKDEQTDVYEGFSVKYLGVVVSPLPMQLNA